MFDPLQVYQLPPRHLWPEGAETRSKFGQSVLWWPKKNGGFHMSIEELEPYVSESFVSCLMAFNPPQFCSLVFLLVFAIISSHLLFHGLRSD